MKFDKKTIIKVVAGAGAVLLTGFGLLKLVKNASNEDEYLEDNDFYAEDPTEDEDVEYVGCETE